MCLHLGPCELGAELVRWAREQPAGGFVRCELGHRVHFVAPETCLERVEGDAAHAVFPSAGVARAARDA